MTRIHLLSLLAGTVAVATAAGCGRQTAAVAPERPAMPAATASARSEAVAKRAPRGTALAAVARLVVAGRAPLTGYARDRFGRGWVDSDRNGCDTRDDILKRDLGRARLRPGTHGCVVTSGTLRDPYTAATIGYVRGGGASVDIDHVVALGDAWQKGARRWPLAKRVALANDPLNLLAVSAGANRQKGDGDAATWLPANRRFRCLYVARQVAVKLKFALRVTAAERDAMRRVLSSCPTLRLPGFGAAPTLSVTSGPAPAPRRTPGARAFANCAAARAAGVAPIRRGTPLYDANAALDRDQDGVACE